MHGRAIACLLGLGLSLGLLTPRCADAYTTEYTTGDLGNNVINDAGDFVINPTLAVPSPYLPAEIEVKYGLWNSPNVPVDVLINSHLVGSFTANAGYLSPGPKFITFDATGLLVDGTNAVKLTGHSASSGDYVIGQVWLRYTPVPEPATLWVCLLALATLRRR